MRVGMLSVLSFITRSPSAACGSVARRSGPALVGLAADGAAPDGAAPDSTVLDKPPAHHRPGHARWLHCLLLVTLAGVAGAAQAQGKVVIYRCTDALGQLTVQNNTPCPKGSQQEKRVLEGAPTSSAPPTFITSPVAPYAPANAPPPHPPVSSQLPSVKTAAASKPAAATPPAPQIADADRLPPPVLFECRTYDNGRYLNDDANPPQRCAQLQTTGLGGNPSPGVGVACQMVTDQCQRLPDEALCENWKQRLREAQSALRFGRSDSRDASAAEVARIQRIVTESTCGR